MATLEEFDINNEAMVKPSAPDSRFVTANKLGGFCK